MSNKSKDTATGRIVRVTLHSSRETSPISKHHQRQPLAVEVPNGLSRLKGGVRKPDLTSLLQKLKAEVVVRKGTVQAVITGVWSDKSENHSLWLQSPSWLDQRVWPLRQCVSPRWWPLGESLLTCETFSSYLVRNVFIELERSSGFKSIFTLLCRPPLSEPMTSWSPWMTHGQRNQTARLLLYL